MSDRKLVQDRDVSLFIGATTATEKQSKLPPPPDSLTPFSGIKDCLDDQESSVHHVCFANSKSAGEAYNMRAVSTVIHMLPDFNPGVQRQAAGRAIRLGRVMEKPVQIYTLFYQAEKSVMTLRIAKSICHSVLLGIGAERWLDCQRVSRDTHWSYGWHEGGVFSKSKVEIKDLNQGMFLSNKITRKDQKKMRSLIEVVGEGGGERGQKRVKEELGKRMF